MRTGQLVAHNANLSISFAYTNSTSSAEIDCGNPFLDDLDFSDPVAVEAARESIVRMEVWQRIAGWAFVRDGELDALLAIADIVLCRKACAWQCSHSEQQAAPGLSLNHLRSAQVTLFSLLSARGANVMTTAYELLPDGIHYRPDTRYAEADAFLEMLVSEPVIHAVLEKTGGACDAADTLREHARIWRIAQPASAEAIRWTKKGLLAEARMKPDTAALAQEKAAAAWEAAGRHDEAAVSYDHASGNWWTAGMAARGARASEMAAIAATAGLQQCEAGRLYLEAAWGWQSVHYPSAAQACEKGAVAFLDAGETGQAVNARMMAISSWLSAGLPDQAVQTCVKALQDAAPEPLAAVQVRAKGRELFEIKLECEKAGS